MSTTLEKKSSECYYNSHFLYVESGAATQSQIETSFKEGIKAVSARLNRQFSTNLKVNVVSDRHHNKFGYSYIWVEDEEVYHMLLGNNPDGTPHIRYEDQPGWVCPPREEKIEDYSWENLCKNDKKSWADIMDEEDEIQKKYQCPQIKIILPPLITLPSFSYTEAQQKELQKIRELQKLRENEKNEKNEKNENEKNEDIPSECILVPGRAYANVIDENCCHNILCARFVPHNITEEMIKEKFKMFASNRYKQHKRKINGVISHDTYPHVTINHKRLAFVTFDYQTQDASFARLMNRKLEFEIDSKSYTLIFKHSYKSKSNC